MEEPKNSGGGFCCGGDREPLDKGLKSSQNQRKVIV